MAESSWTILYDRALRSHPRQLVANLQLAREAISSRLGAIRSCGVDADLNERRAIFFALSDLHVLSVSVRFY